MVNLIQIAKRIMLGIAALFGVLVPCYYLLSFALDLVKFTFMDGLFLLRQILPFAIGVIQLH